MTGRGAEDVRVAPTPLPHAAAHRLRVAMLSHHFPLREGDWKAPFVVARAQALARHADLTVVHAVPWTQGVLPGDADAPLRIRRARYLYVPRVGKRFDGRLLARSVRDVLAAERPDVVEAQFGYPDGEAAVAVAREIGCPVAIVLRGTEQILARDPSRGGRLRDALVAADAVLPVSRTLGDLATSLGVPAERVRVVENGIDVDTFRPGDARAARELVGLPADGRLLLAVGHFHAAKGYAEAIEAFAKVLATHTDLRFALIGKGPDEDALRELVARLGLGKRVLWPGVQPHARIADFLRAADLFVHASHSEGRPNVVLEAQACGLPAVATDVGGTREVVEDGVTGLLVPPRDPTALAAAIDRALRRGFDRAEVARRGLARTWDDTARALVAVYGEIVARRRAAAPSAPAAVGAG